METQPTTTARGQAPRQNFSQRNSLSLKIIIIGTLILLLLIPLALVRGLISERGDIADAAIYEVQDKWSGTQQITGPCVRIPFYADSEERYYEGEVAKVRQRRVEKSLYLLPETLEIAGNIETQTLKRGLYDIVVYKTPLVLQGRFIIPEEYVQGVEPGSIFPARAMLEIGISDLRGISEQVQIEWGDEMLECSPGVSSDFMVKGGVSASLPSFHHLQAGDSVDFCIRLHVKGSQRLLFAPLGKTTEVRLASNCTTPSFTGSFLPENREVTEDGFAAYWKILYLNRNYPQIFTSEPNGYERDLSVFGVDLLLPVQQYQQSMRSVKYAFLIIILTFVVCFFVEVLQKINIHPFQYLLVGLALCLFYTLLVSISEHLGFALAYLVSAVMTITLLAFYMAGLLKIRRTAFTIGALLAFLYIYIYVLIQMETYALLAGSLGLFVILAVIMYYSQKIHWNGTSGE